MKLIRAYISLYVCNYVTLPPLATADLIKSGCYGCCKIQAVDFPTVIKQVIECIFAKFQVGMEESQKNEK